MAVEPTPGARMIYLIGRRPGVTRDELVAHWYKNHMPSVIRRQGAARDKGRLHARRYEATLYDPLPDGRDLPWDGAAHLWFDEALPMPAEPHGTVPADSFQERAEPYVPWATTEYVFVDGELPIEPLTLDDAFPTSRTNRFKAVLMGAAVSGAADDMLGHWLGTHGAEVAERAVEAGAERYVVAASNDPATAPFVAMAELTFADRNGWERYLELRTPDARMDELVDRKASLALTSSTEFIGIA